jgi:NADH:ubiquinone oxidoreductase subunit F (NADH-binding)
VLDSLAVRGGLHPGVTSATSRETGVPEADVYGAGSFYDLLAHPDIKLRVCTGVSCLLRGSAEVLAAARSAGMPAEGCSCLAACDRAPAVLRGRHLLPEIEPADIDRAGGEWSRVSSRVEADDGVWTGRVGPLGADPDRLAIGLLAGTDYAGTAARRASELGPATVIAAIEASGLQGRGGAGFPAARKWRAVAEASGDAKYVVLNADEGEPGTFKDREALLRRPDRVIEGLVIAARAVGAREIHCYLREAFEGARTSLQAAIAAFEATEVGDGLRFVVHRGHGAYICGEETALLEAIEGRRGQPRLRPPYPAQHGLWGAPTLIHNVETIACVPAIVERGGEWFRALGRGEAGTKLYSVSGHVRAPGVYELPIGVTLDELVAVAGGYDGELRAFSPGGASSGLLPASERTRPLDYRSLAEVGSSLGSAGVVVLNATADIPAAVRALLAFFEAESCGQCAPCRIGTRLQREAVDALRARRAPDALGLVEDIAWEMNEGSICGLGHTASTPLLSALRYFPEDFRS